MNELDEISQMLSYCPATGEFRWCVGRGRIKAGDVAGSVPDSIHNCDTGVCITGTLEIDGVAIRAVAWSFASPMLIIW